MPRRNDRSVVKVAPTTTQPLVRQIGRQLVSIDAEYRVPSVHPKDPGPWANEADKVAWTDPMAGYGCIIRRSPRQGHLCGYVAVGSDHPLYGWSPAALVGLHIHVHGGVSYAAACEAYEPEETSVCHVVRPMRAAVDQTIHDNGLAPDEAWWFGFECNQAGDALPHDPMQYAHSNLLDGITERVYRDEAYVHDECVRLAAQLKAIEEGRDPVEVVTPGAAGIGYDPGKAVRS